MKMYHPSQKSKRHDRILAIQFLSLRNPSKLSYLINDRFKKYLLHPILFVWRWTKVFPNLIDFNLRGDRRHPPLSLSFPRSEFSVIRRLPGRTLRTAKDVVETIPLCET